MSTRYLSFVACLIAALAFAATSGLVSAKTPPTCHGKQATIWKHSADGRIVQGTPGPDVIVTGAGDDRIHAGRGWDVVCSGAGEDIIQAGTGTDRVYSGAGFDFVAGYHGDDVLCAYGGNDGVFGGQGSDWISVGSGVNFYDADGRGSRDDSFYRQWIADGYTYSVGIGSSGNDVMTGGMIHEQGATLDKRWSC
ncbi:MAG: hypothetical protein KDB52_09535 [Solirubrobacterales bacterium]|nr:hypothetical protein [Solirubrobacterales bacterium]